MFVSRAIKANGLIKLIDFIDSPLVTVEDATKKIFQDLFNRLKQSLCGIDKEETSFKKIEAHVAKGMQSINYSLLNQVTQIMPTNS